MSRHRVETVRAVYERWAKGDFTASTELFDENTVFVLGPGFPDPGGYRGAAEIADYMRQFLEPWERLTMSAEELVDAGDTVFVTVRQRGTGSSSGVDSEFVYHSLWTFRGPTLVRMENFRDRGEALAAAGLENEPGTESNAEIARRLCEAAWRRPKPDLETIAALGHPEHEMFTIQSLVEGGGYTGAEGFREWLASWNEMFGEDWDATVEEATEADAERVLVTGHMQAEGRHGAPVRQRFWVVMWITGGRATRSEVHTEESRALEVAGLG